MSSNEAQCRNFIVNKNDEDHVRTPMTCGFATNENTISGENSDELFSDEEETKELTKCSPDTSLLTDTSLAALDLSTTSLLHCNRTPGATIPSTPLSLIPFLSKVNEQWTSDLETPQMNKRMYKDPMSCRTKSSEKLGSKHLRTTLNIKSADTECLSTSPVINSNRTRKRPKRRIFKSCESSELVEKINHTGETVNTEIKHTNIKNECDQIIAHGTSDSADKHKVVNSTLDGNMDSLEFFANASFDTIDKICSENFKETHQINFNEKCNKNIDIETVNKTSIVSTKQNISSDISKQIISIDSVKRKNITTNCMFSTASGKPTIISEKALLAAKTKFEDEFKDDFKIEQNFELSTDTKNIDFSSDVICNIPHKPIKPTCLISKNEKVPMEDDKGKNPVINVLFSTASGKPVTVSEKALSKAEALLSDDLENNTVSGNILPDKKTDITKVSIKHNRLQNLTQFKDVKRQSISSNIIESPVKKSPIKLSSSVSRCLFSTASGKAVKVSETALSKAKSLFADDLICNDETIVPSKEQNLRETGSNRKLREIEQNTENIKQNPILCEATDNQNSVTLSITNKIDFSEKENIPSVSHMVTDNDKGITNLEDMPAFFENDYSSRVSLNAAGKRSDTVATGFSSASGFPICASKPALLKAEELFSEKMNGDDQLCDSFRKRRLEDPNIDVGLVQHDTYNSKKARFSNETKKENSTEEIITTASTCVTNDKNPIKMSQAKCTVENNMPGSSSPILGRKVTLKKRRKRKGLFQNQDVKAEDKQTNSEKKLDYREISKLSVQNASCDKSSSNYNSNSTTVETNSTLKKEPILDGTSSSEFGDTQIFMDYIMKTDDILEKRTVALNEQEKIINKKMESKEQQITGKLFSYKYDNRFSRISWRQLTNGSFPKLCSQNELIDRGISPDVLKITACTAGSYRFQCFDFYTDIESNTHGLKMEDGAYLILDENGYIGICEIKRSFLASPGVDPNLLPLGWVENHYRWIVWKLASMDRVKFETVDLPRALTLANVMAQLKYRYDKEIDRSQRSTLRQILEKDSAASKRMVLCVSSITEYKNVALGKGQKTSGCSQWKVSVTDGWYEIPVSIDLPMVNYIASGKVQEGTKLITFGAELINCEQGCSPLEIPSDICLKIHTNSTRRARWDTKLGYTHSSGPIPVRLKNVCSNGGLIGKITVTVAREYPILYHEKIIEGETSKSVFRNARSEEKANIAYEKKIESFYADAEKEFDTRRSSRSSQSDSIGLLAAELNDSFQDFSEQEFASKQEQEKLLNEYRLKEEELKKAIQSKLQENLPPPRQVSPVLKIRLVDEEKCGILTIWSPSDEIVDILKENNCVVIRNVFASGRRGDELQLTASRNTTFEKQTMENTFYSRRVYTPLYNITKPSFTPAYSEFDTVGLVVSVTDGPYKNFEAVNLACPESNSPNCSYLSILFWQGVSSYGYDDILTVGSFVACDNLEWRRVILGNIPVAYCTERTVFTRNPRRPNIREPFEELTNLLVEPFTIIAKCAEEIASEMQKRSISRTGNTPDKILKFDKSMLSSDGNSINSPRESFTSNSESGDTPQHIARSAAMLKRLEKLKYYDEPPRISPIIIRNSSKRVSLDFRSPICKRNIKMSDSSSGADNVPST